MFFHYFLSLLLFISKFYFSCAGEFLRLLIRNADFSNRHIFLFHGRDKSTKKLIRRYFLPLFHETDAGKNDAIWINFLPCFGESGKVLHDPSAQLSFGCRVVPRHVERMTKDVLDLIGVHDTHPLAPRVCARSLSHPSIRHCFLVSIYQHVCPFWVTHLSKMIVIDVHSVFGEFLGKIIRRAGKVVICARLQG